MVPKMHDHIGAFLNDVVPDPLKVVSGNAVLNLRIWDNKVLG